MGGDKLWLSFHSYPPSLAMHFHMLSFFTSLRWFYLQQVLGMELGFRILDGMTVGKTSESEEAWEFHVPTLPTNLSNFPLLTREMV